MVLCQLLAKPLMPMLAIDPLVCVWGIGVEEQQHSFRGWFRPLNKSIRDPWSVAKNVTEALPMVLIAQK